MNEKAQPLITMNQGALTPEYLRECFDYDRGSGLLTWKHRPPSHFSSPRVCKIVNAQNAGKQAGYIDSHGYIAVRIAGRSYRAHRIAWAVNYGSWPALQIDHVNGARNDNRIDNLRETSHAENQQNRKGCTKNSVTKYLGVIKDKKTYRAQITVGGMVRRIGNFATPEDAHAAYIVEKRKAHSGNTL